MFVEFTLNSAQKFKIFSTLLEVRLVFWTLLQLNIPCTNPAELYYTHYSMLYYVPTNMFSHTLNFVEMQRSTHQDVQYFTGSKK